MADPHVLKVFHAARQDVEIFWKLAGVVPTPDVRHPGRGDGLRLWRAGFLQRARAIDLPDRRSTNPRASPIGRAARSREAQIDYAIGDVTHLRDIYRALLAKLKATGRQSWLEDEMRVLTSAATYEQHPERAWERFKNRARASRAISPC